MVFEQAKTGRGAKKRVLLRCDLFSISRMSKPVSKQKFASLLVFPMKLFDSFTRRCMSIFIIRRQPLKGYYLGAF